MVILKRKVSKWKFWKKERYYLPSSFEELSFDQVIEIQEKKTINEILGFDLPVDLYVYLSWIYDLPDFSKIEQADFLIIEEEVLKIPDIRKKEFGKIILLKEILKKKDKNINYICKALALYLTPEMNEDSFKEMELKIKKTAFIKVYSCFLNLLNQYDFIIKMEKNLPKTTATKEQSEAGYGRLNELGDFNVIDIISVRNGYKLEEVERLDYNTIYMLLWRINELDNYEKRLKKIYDNKRTN